MLKRFIKTKLHGLTITEADIIYEGSIGIDSDILKKSKLYPGQFVLVANINNGERFNTYIIEESKGSKKVTLNGAAARLGTIGDRIIIMAEELLEKSEIENFKMDIFHFDENNNII